MKGEPATGLATACSPGEALKSGPPNGLAVLRGRAACMMADGRAAGLVPAGSITAPTAGCPASWLFWNMVRNEKLMERTVGSARPLG